MYFRTIALLVCACVSAFAQATIQGPTTITGQVQINAAQNGPATVLLTPLAGSTLNFGSQNVSSTGGAQSVALQNIGGQALAISSIAPAGTNAADFAATNTCGVSVNPGAACSISITFTPTAPGAHSATLVLTDSSPSSPQLFYLTGTGIAIAAGFSVTPASYNFGSHPVTVSSAAETFTITNPGNQPLAVSSILSQGANAADFVVSAKTCSTVAPAGGTPASCTFAVTFTPSIVGAESASIVITSSDSLSPHSLPVSGTGLSTGTPAATISASSISFATPCLSGTGTCGELGPVQSVTLTNTGNGPLQISSITPTGTNPNDFVVYGGNCPQSPSVLPASASCSISVGFTPTATGSRSASITILDNSNNISGSTQAIALSGSTTNAVFYIDQVAGSDASGTGAKTVPYFTLNHGTRTNPGSNQTFFIRNANYQAGAELINGVEPETWGGNAITIKAYPGEYPVFTGFPSYSLELTGSHLLVDGVNISGAGGGVYVPPGCGNSYITLQNMTMRMSGYEWLRFDPCVNHITVQNDILDTNGFNQSLGSGAGIALSGVQYALIRNTYIAKPGHYAVEGDTASTNYPLDSAWVILDDVNEESYGGGYSSNTPSIKHLLVQNGISSHVGWGTNYPKTTFEGDNDYSIFRWNFLAYQSGWYGNEQILIFSKALGDDNAHVSYNYAYENDLYLNECNDYWITEHSFNYNGTDYWAIPVAHNALLNSIFQNATAPTNCVATETYANGAWTGAWGNNYGAPWTYIVGGNSYETITPSLFPQMIGNNSIHHNLLELADTPLMLNFNYSENPTPTNTLANLQSSYPGQFWNNITGNANFVSPGEPQAADFRLQPGSPAIAAGGHFTTTTAAGTNTTTIPVADPHYFFDGWTMLPGDYIRVGSNAPVQITKVYTALDSGNAVLGYVPMVAAVNNLTGYVGWQFTVESPITVSSVARWCQSGNAQTHTVGIAAAGAFLGSTSVNCSGATAGFNYQPLSPTLILTPGTIYTVASTETNGGDRWYPGTNVPFQPASIPIQDSYGVAQSSLATIGQGGGVVQNDAGPVSFTFTPNNPQNQLIVASPISFPSGATVDLANFNGSAPDMGAVPYSTTSPTISNLGFTANGPTSEIIAWTTATAATDQVKYGLSSFYGLTSLKSTAVGTTHSVTLNDLQPKETYHFSAVSVDATFGIARSPDQSFTTIASPGPVVSNVQVSYPASGQATISWDTSVPTTGAVAYSGGNWTWGLSAQSATVDPNGATTHTVSLTNLGQGLGQITALAPNAAGQNFQVGDVLTVALSGANSGTATVTSINASGGITGLSVATGGSLYYLTTGATLSGGHGTGATANITAINGTGAVYHYSIESHDPVTNLNTIGPDSLFWTLNTLAAGPQFSGLTAVSTVAPESFHTAATGNTGYTDKSGTYQCGGSSFSGSSSNSCCGYSYADETFTWISSESVTNPLIQWTPANAGSGCLMNASFSNAAPANTSTVEGNPAATTSPSLKIYQWSPKEIFAFRIEATDGGNLTTESPVYYTVTSPDIISDVPIIAPQMYNTASCAQSGSNTACGWTTDTPSTSQVLYGLTSAYGGRTAITDLGGVTSHSVTISGLPSGTTFHFAVQSQNSQGMLSTSQDGTFTTSGLSGGNGMLLSFSGSGSPTAVIPGNGVAVVQSGSGPVTSFSAGSGVVVVP